MAGADARAPQRVRLCGLAAPAYGDDTAADAARVGRGLGNRDSRNSSGAGVGRPALERLCYARLAGCTRTTTRTGPVAGAGHVSTDRRAGAGAPPGDRRTGTPPARAVYS